MAQDTIVGDDEDVSSTITTNINTTALHASTQLFYVLKGI
jgi:hypothetical protein